MIQAQKDPQQLETRELQEMVLWLGSKKALGLHLVLTSKALEVLWNERGLYTPTQHLTTVADVQLFAAIGERGLKGAARRFGISASTLQRELRIRAGVTTSYLLRPTLEVLEHALKRYGSVTLVARILGLKAESDLRTLAKEYNLDLKTCIDYSAGGFSNAKGRRAELEFIKLRGSQITEDLNLTQGSKAPYDVFDLTYGRVNVKSSRQFSYQKRRVNAYWKISTRGVEQCDTIAALCYDQPGTKLVGVAIRRAADLPHTRSVVFEEKDLIKEGDPWPEITVSPKV